MDRNEVRRRALLGAAKVAFSATLVGCGGITIVDSNDGEGGAGGSSTTGEYVTNAASTADATSAAVTTAGVTTAATTGTGIGPNACGVGDKPYAQAALECCDALLKETFPVSPAPAPATISSDTVACCNAALQVRDVDTPEGQPVPGDLFAWEFVYPCCQYEGVVPPQPVSPTCTPWGPPVPPAMLDDLDWLEAVA